MTEIDKTLKPAVSRRNFLTRAAAAGVGIAALGLAASAGAATTPKQPEADTGHDYPLPAPHAMTAKQFGMGVIGPATLSRITSEIAVDKATNPEAKEFANFELREAIAVTTVLHQMGIPNPPMNAAAKATLAKIKSSEGAAFDKTYIKAQLANHEFLRDLAENYLKNSEGHLSIANMISSQAHVSTMKDMEELHGRHLAMLSLATFKEHVVHTKNILGDLMKAA